MTAAVVEAVLLDAAGTLFEERLGRAALYARALARHACPRPVEQVATWMAAAHDQLPAPRPRYGEAWFDTFVGRVLAAAGCSADAGVVRRELTEVFLDPATYTVFDDVRPCLARLAAAGLRLAVVSNWSAQLPLLLERLELAPAFEVLAVSASVDADKPAPALFEHALAGLGTSAARAMHVGDHPLNDLAGARAAGLTAFLLDRRGEHPHEPARVPDLLALAERLGV